MTVVASPLTAPLADALEIVAPASLPPTNPPSASAPVPLTGPDAVDCVIVPGFCPTRPPTREAAPPVTLPVAEEFAMEPRLLEMPTPARIEQMLSPHPVIAAGSAGVDVGPAL